MAETAPNPPPTSTPPVQLPKLDPKAIIDTAIAVITKPREFYKGIKDEQGFVKCLTFSVPMGIAMGVFALVRWLVYGFWVQQAIRDLVQQAVGGLVGPFIGGFILYGICLAFGSKASWEPSIRIAAYAYAVGPVAMVCLLVPWIGWIGAVAAACYAIYLLYVGAKELNFAPAPAAPPPAP